MSVKVEPCPSRLSARRRPWCASTMSRQTASPRPVPPCPAASGRGLGRVERLEDPPQVGRRDPHSRVGDAQLDPAAGGVESHPDAHHPALGHRLTGVDQEVEEHLLDLCRVDPRRRLARQLHVQLDAMTRQVLLDQHDHFLDQPDDVGRLAVVDAAAGPGQAEHPPRDRRGALGRVRRSASAPARDRPGRDCGVPAWRRPGSASARCSVRGRRRRPGRPGC